VRWIAVCMVVLLSIDLKRDGGPNSVLLSIDLKRDGGPNSQSIALVVVGVHLATEALSPGIKLARR